MDDWMAFPPMPDFSDIDRKLYGKNASHVMKTDVHEDDAGYTLDIDLPGFKKEEIALDLENGYLTVQAAKQHEDKEKDKNGSCIRRERFAGSMQRSFYVGDAVTEEDVKARFENGVLDLFIPKKQAQEIPAKKTIMIEG